ncbi:MAG: DNA replication and repair protein RecF, partial [Bacillota bacterium]|nr:DNA replication and repair protein RecF [Bacillota bacterium]
MYAKYIQLVNYRNYKELFIELNKNLNVFIGNNAQGKTNILESIYYCGFGKSHRTSKDKELIRWNEEEAYIKLYVARERLDKKIEIKILKEGKKAININSIKINKISELMGSCNVVMFSPEDLKIVKESPGHRRRFLDMELCQLDGKYYYNLVQYNKVLAERNSVLKNRNIDKSILDIYDIQLSAFGEYIIKKRIGYIKKLNNYGKEIHREITSQKEEIEFDYLTQVKDFENIRDEMLNLLT